MTAFRTALGLFLVALVSAAAVGQAPADPPPVVRRIYGIGDLVRKGAGDVQSDGKADTAERVVRALLIALATPAGKGPAIEILNGTRLAIEAAPAQHAQVVELLQSFRRLGDITMLVRADLYEVDTDLYMKLKNAKRLSVEEQERIFLNGGAKGESIFDLLSKQAPVLAAPERKADDGAAVALLSWRRVVRTGATPPQTAFTGVAFQATIHVSADRRFVHAELTEEASAVDAMHKVKTWDGTRKDWVNLEVPLLTTAKYTRILTIPDNGAVLIPVHTRPEGSPKDRRWVLCLHARIQIAEEEQAIRTHALDAILPAVLADILNNPRLKATRDYYGTPDDKRFVLIDSPAWAWPAKGLPAVAGYTLAQRDPTGKRLLGIRVDRFQDTASGTVLAMTLLNAGGGTNGTTVGALSIGYSARSGEKGWTVKLQDGDPP